MSAPNVRINGTTVGTTFSASIASAAYASTPARVQLSGLGSNYLLGDWRITGLTTAFSGAPAAGGTVALYAVDRDFAGNIGPTPSASWTPRFCGNFNPIQSTATGGILALNDVRLSYDADYYLYNNATGVTMYTTNASLSCMPWSPGSS